MGSFFSFAPYSLFRTLVAHICPPLACVGSRQHSPQPFYRTLVAHICLSLAYAGAGSTPVNRSTVPWWPTYACRWHMWGVGNIPLNRAPYPTLPSKLTLNRFCAYTANYIGSFLNTRLQNPFTNIDIASSPLIPR